MRRLLPKSPRRSFILLAALWLSLNTGSQAQNIPASAVPAVPGAAGEPAGKEDDALPAAPAPLEPAPVVATPANRPTPKVPEPTMRLQFPSTSVNEILSLYEVLTDKRLIRDSALAQQGAPLTIMVPGEVPRSEAIRLIEASLLLNGYSFVPVDDKTVKVISLQGGKGPKSEGIPIYSSPYMLPDTEQVVSYFMKLNYLAPQEAVSLFQQFVVPPRPFTSFSMVPNVQAVLITENVPVIQKLIALQAMIDVPPAQVITEFVTLQRADAEKVAEVLQGLIDARKEGNTPKPAAQAGQPGQPVQPQGDAQGQIVPVSLGTAGGGQFESNLVIGETHVVADPRTNRILIVTRPINFPYIKKLIEQLDAPVPLDTALERPLKYVSSSDVLPVLSDLLQEGEESGGTGKGTRGGQGGDATTTTESTFGQGSTSGGLGGSAGLNRPDRLKEPTTNVAPESVIIGKTKLIADKSANSIIVIGPPDSRHKVAQLLDMLDVRPRQVYLAAVIGQLQLTDDMEFGFSYFLRYKGADGSGVAGSLINPLSAASDAVSIFGGSNAIIPSNLINPTKFPNLSGLTVYGTIADSVDIYARALEKTGRFKILSRPVVYTTNNKKAVISSGEQVPFTSSTLTSTSISGTAVNQSAGITANITYKDVLLKLEVVPLINANKDVTLVIAQSNSNIVRYEDFGGGNRAPIVSAQELTTTVTVPNGGTVVLGGLIIESTQANDSGLPFLMRIPVLGYLFKQTARNVKRTELLVLLQPTVVEDNSELARASEEERYRTKVGDDIYSGANAWDLGRTPVLANSPQLEPDSQIRKPRDPLRPAGIDYQQYAPDPTPRPTPKPKPTPKKKQRSAT